MKWDLCSRSANHFSKHDKVGEEADCVSNIMENTIKTCLYLGYTDVVIVRLQPVETYIGHGGVG